MQCKKCQATMIKITDTYLCPNEHCTTFTQKPKPKGDNTIGTMIQETIRYGYSCNVKGIEA